MGTRYFTLCCGFEFFGKNHSPEHEGKCRNCKAKWIGAAARAKGDLDVND